MHVDCALMKNNLIKLTCRSTGIEPVDNQS